MSDKFSDGIRAGSTDVSIPIVLRKSADGTEQTGKVAADMTISYWRQGGIRVAIVASDLAALTSNHSDGGVKEVDATNMPGSYRLDLPDAAVAAGADWVVVTIQVGSTFVYYERFPITSGARLADGVAHGGATATIVASFTGSITGNITGSLSGTVGSVATVTNIADAVLVRGASNVEDTADRHSLGAMIMIGTNGVMSGSTLTARKPSDDSTFQTYTTTTDENATPVTGVS